VADQLNQDVQPPSKGLAGAADRALVLMYHRVGHAMNDWERRYCVDPSQFSAHMHALRDRGFRAVDIDRFAAWMAGHEELPAGSFLLTFDDGFQGVYEHARPVLQALGWPATVFIVSGLIGGEDVWDEANNPARRRHRLLNHAQIEQMWREGFSFQSHSRHHADLTRLDDERLAEELEGSRFDIERLLEAPVRYLAFPYGRFDARVQQAARSAGYGLAFSTKPGFNRPGRNTLEVLRLEVEGTDSPAALLRKMKFGSNDGSIAAVMRYAMSRARRRLGFS
jgi:peptidoglycan/xylan/chitin deacetylase (PgdA/CDA1 family)